MQFALLGICDSSFDLARAVESGRDHELVSIFAAHGRERDLAEHFPTTSQGGDWETLLGQREADAVIVASDDSSEIRNDQLRKLVQAGVPLVLVHPACDAMVGYELDMIRSDSGSTLFPFVRGQRTEAVAQAVRTIEQGDNASIGYVEQIVVEHFLEDRRPDNVLATLACDAGLLLPMIGKVDEVSAFGPEHGASNYSALSVNLTGTSKIPVRWSVVPAAGNEGAVTTVVGTRGRLVLSMLGDPSTWSLQGSHGVLASSEPSGQDASRALDEFKRMLADEGMPLFSWSDACRTLEIQTAVRDSLRRGRKMQLYDEQYSEQQTFKGKMAVGGCSLLLVALLLLFGFALFDVLTMPFRDRSVSPDAPAEPATSLWLRLWPAYPLIAFLVLQLLKLVFANDRRAQARSGQSETANATRRV